MEFLHLLMLLQCVMGWILLHCALTSENSDNTLLIVLKTSLSLHFQLPENIPRENLFYSLVFKVYCVCRLPDDGSRMVACSKCSKWFHLQCTTITTEEELEQDWFCFNCTGMTHQ